MMRTIATPSCVKESIGSVTLARVFRAGLNRWGDAFGVVRLGGHLEPGEMAIERVNVLGAEGSLNEASPLPRHLRLRPPRQLRALGERLAGPPSGRRRPEGSMHRSRSSATGPTDAVPISTRIALKRRPQGAHIRRSLLCGRGGAWRRGSGRSEPQGLRPPGARKSLWSQTA